MAQEENDFIHSLIENETPVNIYLVSGIKLVGVIVRHDDRVLILENGGITQLVYKHAASTVLPSRGGK